MYQSKPLSNNRLFIYHFLRRALKFHCPMTACLRLDITDTLKRIEQCREAGQKISFIAYTTLASAKTIEAHPKLNRRLYYGLLRKSVATFDHITAGLVVGRKDPQGEDVLLPLTIRNTNERSLEELHGIIKGTKADPLDKVGAYDKLQQVRTLPRVLIGFMHFLFRSSPKYTDEKFSTYALSSVTSKNGAAIGGHTVANQTTFFPGNLRDEVLAIDGEAVVRKVLYIGLSADHFVVDGMDLQRAVGTFQNFMENPDTLLPKSDTSPKTE